MDQPRTVTLDVDSRDSSLDPAKVDAPTFIRFQILAQPDAKALRRILGGLLNHDVLPNRVIAAVDARGVLQIEVEMSGMMLTVIHSIATALHRTPYVLRTQWSRVSRSPTCHHRPTSNDRANCLSPRERQVVRELALGHPNKVIARRLALAAPTVNFHMRNIFRKLGVHKRAQVVSEASRRGWLE